MDTGYWCAVCGEWSPLLVDILDSGTTVRCLVCGGRTVIDLSAPQKRAAYYAEIVRLQQLIAAAARVVVEKGYSEDAFDALVNEVL